MQNLNEISARYTELPNEFYIPENWRPQDTKNKQSSTQITGWDPIIPGTDSVFPDVRASEVCRMICEQAYDAYKALLDAGIAREMARFVLPVNIYTEIYTTWDLKNLLHFITLREDSHAQYEIQVYGMAIKKILQELFPWTMEAYELYQPVMQKIEPCSSPAEKSNTTPEPELNLSLGGAS